MLQHHGSCETVLGMSVLLLQVVDFGPGGPLHCNKCKAYINPFMRFLDNGRMLQYNFCSAKSETPPHYVCNTGPDGRRHDADEKAELCRGSVDFVATESYMVCLLLC